MSAKNKQSRSEENLDYEAKFNIINFFDSLYKIYIRTEKDNKDIKIAKNIEKIDTS
jgi:hypothetical protein